jgi:hypothetical protein
MSACAFNRLAGARRAGARHHHLDDSGHYSAFNDGITIDIEAIVPEIDANIDQLQGFAGRG